MGLHQRGDKIAERELVGVAEAGQHFVENALTLGRDQRFHGQRLDTLHQHAAQHFHRRGAAGLRPQRLGIEAVGVHPGDHGLDIYPCHQHRRLDARLEEAAHDRDVDVTAGRALDGGAILIGHRAGDRAQIEIVCAFLQQRRGGLGGLQGVFALDGANHQVRLAQRRGVAALDRDIERPGFPAERRAARVLVECGVDGDQAARGVVARPSGRRSRRAAPAAVGAKPARDRRSRLTKAQQRDHARRQRHAPALDDLLAEFRRPAPRRPRRCARPQGARRCRASWRCAAWAAPRPKPAPGCARRCRHRAACPTR